MNRETFLLGTDDLNGTKPSARPAQFSGNVAFRSLAFVLAALSICLPRPAFAAGAVKQLSGHVPSAISRLNLQPVSDFLASTNRLNLAIGLPLHNPVELSNFLAQLSNPASTNYHKYLTPDQFADRFGPTPQDYQNLIDFAHANGFEVVLQHTNRMLLDVQAPVANIENAFQVKFHVYQHPTEHRTFFAPESEPSVPAGLPVSDVSGLNNYGTPHPKMVVKPSVALKAGAPRLGSGPGGEYFGYDFRAAYAPGVTLTGAGQTLILVEFDGYAASDIAAYDAQSGLPQVNLQNILLDGFGGAPTGTGGEVEVSLDIEMANAMAPGLSRIISYEGSPNNFIPNDVLNRIATDNAGKEVSCSWGWTGGPTATTDQIFQQMIAQGQTFFDASGDSDAFANVAAGGVDDPTLDNVPSDNPFITQVGATTLSTTGPLGGFTSETVWQVGGGVGSSGGISSFYAIPSWQQPVSMTLNGGSTKFRNLPDVAAAGDNIYVIADSGFAFDVGGTSCAAPLWAAFIALANQKAALTSSPSVGFLNPAIYSLALGPLYGTTMHDVVKGNDTNIINPTNFFAVPGFDLCTGFGSMAGQPLIDALVPATLEVPLLSVYSNTIFGGNGNGRIDPDECNNLNVVLTNMGLVAATGVQATLSSLTPNVFVGVSTVSYPDLLPAASAPNSTPFTVSTQPGFVCGTPVTLQLVVRSVQVTQTNLIQIATGVIGAPVRFDNSASTSLPTGNLNGIFSPVTVSGIGSVGKVTVSIYLTALEDEFMAYELVSPDGTASILAVGDGGIGANFGTACAPDTSRTTFDDAATVSVNAGFAPFTGSYQPLTPLSVFNLKTGTNVNGTWQLNVIDELTNNISTLQCWSLFISPELCPDGGGTCPGSDLSVTMSVAPITSTVGTPVYMTINAFNAGPSTATNVEVIQSLPPGLQYLGSTLSQGSAAVAGSNITFSLGTLGVLTGATITVQVVPSATGLLTSTATIGSPSSDPNPNNNSASTSVLVTRPESDLAVTMTVAPTLIPVDGQATFLIGVTNNGPSTANGVTLTNFLPANATVVSATTTQGTVSPSGTLVSLGTLNNGIGAQVTLVLSPTSVGNFTLTSGAGLATNEVDPVSFNNTATTTITVAPAADLGISLVVLPSPTIAGANFTNTITITNAGPNPATAVVMTETLPAGATFVSDSQAGATQSGGVVTWNIGIMTSGTSQVLTTILKAPTLIKGVSSNVMVTTANVFGQPTDPNTANNTVVVTTLDLPPEVVIVPGIATLAAPFVAVNPGQTVVVQLGLQNMGNIPTTNLVATLQANAGVTPSSLPQFGPQTYGALAPGGGTGTGQFSFTANSTNGGTVVATLQLQDGTNNLGTASFTFIMPNVTTFWNNGLISIPATNYISPPFNSSGPAAPYPSSNFVYGITSFVANVTVTVSNLYHTYPSDIELLLVGPGGQSSVLMSDAAQQTTMTAPVTITFDQTAPTPVLAQQALVSGSYQPGQYNTPVFTGVTGVSPPPPAGHYTVNLNVFAGQPVNGGWELYAYDGSQGDFGRISNGWALSFTTLIPVNPVADLGVGVTAAPSQLFVGSNVTFTVSVTNLGTNATTVFLTNRLSSGLSFVSTNSPAPASQSGQTEYYNLGSVGGQSNVTFNIVATAIAAGAQSAGVNVGSSLTDPNTNNNAAAAAVTVVQPAADVSAGISAVSGSNTLAAGSTVIIGTNVIYALAATNNGPNIALNVTGVLAQSTAGATNNVFTNVFGNIAPGAGAVAMFTNAPLAAGLLTNIWTLTTASSDTNSANNTVVLPTIAVTPPEPVIVAGGVRLVSESFSPPDGAIDSNETVTISFTLANVGVAPATNLTTTLQATNGVTPITVNQTYGAIQAGASTAQSFQFIGRGAPGSTVTAVLALSDNGYSLGNVSNSFVIPYTTNYANTGFITIPQFGAATPYPSPIVISGVSGLVGKVTATLQGFTHTFPHDVNVLLTSPVGQQTVLMAHVGGPYSATNLVINFDQSAGQALSLGQLTSGTNLPTQGGAADIFPSIVGGSGGSPPPANTNLNVFNGVNPNGAWSLYVYDDTPGNSGNIANGWTLGLTIVNAINAAGTLATGMTHTPDPVIAGNLLSFNMGVTNLSSAPAANVVLTDTLPPNTSLKSVLASQGSIVTNVLGTVSFNLGTIAGNGVVTASLQLEPLQLGTIVNSAVASSSAGVSTPGATAVNSVTVTNLSSFKLAAITLANGVTLTLTTTPAQIGQSYIIQVSTNLNTWTGLATNTAGPTGQFSITTPTTNGPAQFYRAVHLPQ